MTVWRLLFTNSSPKLFLSSHQFTFLKHLLFRRYKEYKQCSCPRKLNERARDERRRNAGQSAWGSLEGPEARLGGGKAFSHRSSRFSQRTAPSAGVPSEKHAPVVTECSEGHREDS